MTHDVRPQLAEIRRRNGKPVPCLVEATDDPDEFVIRRDVRGKPVRVRDGDRLWVDVLGPGQSVTVDGPPPDCQTRARWPTVLAAGAAACALLSLTLLLFGCSA